MAHLDGPPIKHFSIDPGKGSLGLPPFFFSYLQLRHRAEPRSISAAPGGREPGAAVPPSWSGCPTVLVQLSHRAGTAACRSGVSHRCTRPGSAAAAPGCDSAQINKPRNGNDAPFRRPGAWVQGGGSWRPPPAAQTPLPTALPLPRSCEPEVWNYGKVFKNLPSSAIYSDRNSFETGGRWGKKWMTVMKWWIPLKLFLIIIPNFFLFLIKIL